MESVAENRRTRESLRAMVAAPFGADPGPEGEDVAGALVDRMARFGRRPEG